jgi:hypothetical protein
MLKTGDTLPKPDEHYDRWREQYANVETGAPNYPRTIGRLVAGLFQQSPITMTVGDGVTPVLSDGALADLCDRGVKRGAAESVVFIRPTEVEGVFVPALLSRAQVEPVWAHGRLQSAVVWSVHKLSANNMRMITESYTTASDGKQSVVIQLWQVVKDTVESLTAYKLGSEVDVEDVAAETDDELMLAVRQLRGQDRRLFAYAWDFEDGHPIPIHYTNEQLVTQLTDLHAVEFEDNQLPRNIVAVSQESMTADFGDGNDQAEASTWGRLRGLRKGRNMLQVPSDQLAQNGTDAFIKHLRMDDDMIQRERITSKENVFYESCGISASTFGRDVSGRSDSGAAKRADSQLTLTTIAGPARRWAELMTLLGAELARLQNAAATAGPVSVTEGLKNSAEERAALVAVQRGADVQSVEMGVRQIRPDWADPEVAEEVARIRVDNMLTTPAD